MHFESTIQALSEAGVDFVIVGGVAATLHGSGRVTYDLDICYSRTSENLRKLVSTLSPWHPRPRGFPKELPSVWDEATLRNSMILTLETDIGEIDLLAEVKGLGAFEAVKNRAIRVRAFGRDVLTLNLRALIEAKRAAGREKDLAALPELEGLMEADEK
jgi:hypothetical protein